MTGKAALGAASDEALLPLRDQLREWTEWDEAAFFLGRLLGMLPDHYSFGKAKEVLYGSFPGERGRQLVLLLNLLSDIGVLDMRDSYREFRWAREVTEEAIAPNDQDESGMAGP